MAKEPSDKKSPPDKPSKLGGLGDRERNKSIGEHPGRNKPGTSKPSKGK